MSYKIQIRRGLKADLPSLDEGELGLCTDTGELFIGTSEGNRQLADHSEIHELLGSKVDHEEFLSQLEAITNELGNKVDAQFVDEQLENKADADHRHALGDILDVDLTTSEPNNGDVLSFQNGIWKPSLMNAQVPVESSSAVYVIDLGRWGITEGVPTQPYTNDDYYMADANIQGINNALEYAYDNGFTQVILPRGQYAICYPRTIQMKSHLTFHLNQSVLKVIYDSDNRSPFDTRTGTDYYNFSGISITFSNVTNAHLMGGTIIGCRADRSFANSNERRQEHTYGVLLSRGTNHSSVKHCVVRDYMGDGISMDSRSPSELAEFNLNLSLNSIDNSTGEITSSNNSLTSGFITLRDYPQFQIAGFGFNRTTSINTKEVDVFFYREDNSYLQKRQMNKKIYTPITVPVGARKIRLVFRQETNPLKNMNITIKFGNIPHHNVIEHNEVLANHRGGITLGGSYNIVQHNVIRDNGFHQLDDKPLFNDPTRYGINQEDSYGDNCVIRHNLIYNTNHGILAGCYSVHIENNHIYNVTGIGINLYSLSFATVKGNYLYQCGTSAFGLMTANLPGAHVHITDNSVHNSRVNISGSGYTVYVRGNTFVDVEMINMPANRVTDVFKDNILKYTGHYSGSEPTMRIDKIENCIYESNTPSLRSVRLITNSISRSVFSNIRLYLDTRTSNTVEGKISLHDCTFYNSRIDNHIFGTKKREVNVTDSVFQNSRLYVGNINTPNENPLLTVDNSRFLINSITTLINNDINNEDGYGIIKISNCDIEITNDNFNPLISNAFTRRTFEFHMNNCHLMYTGEGTLNLIYYSRLTSMRKFVSANNRFENIILPAEDPDIFVGYDPETHSMNEPSSGFYMVSQIVKNAKPEEGSYIGWVCTQDGIANQNTWQENTSYTVGTQITANGNVYQCTTAGTTGTVAPSHTSGSANDGTTTWEYLGQRALFAPFGLIGS
ncbi:right-handed parallel beta-helix repeat-containing protein [Alkalihalobacterium alkalinitrilicum]|uniref:right-handed parallel beta-helix repeat-containing protein n=1 Tax=Alkalihalobacterium alkalinitrilicum TaxID=427920 RepID=UPI00099567FA|nr:right-handed parallel beta-helix repeat-containing protein [Alkalihalobacterium alkalinitrilicum]